MQRTLCAVLSLFALAAVARADEIRLKDGSKIIGSIVGYEDGSFKVETAYGFAMIRKDSVSEIVTTEPKQADGSKAAPGKPSEDAAPAAAKPPAPAPAQSSESRALTPPKPLVASESKSQPAPLKPAVYAGAKTQPPPASRPLQQATSQPVVSQTPTASPRQPVSPQAAQHSAAVPVAAEPSQPAVAATNSAPSPLFPKAISASEAAAIAAAPVAEAAATPVAPAPAPAAPAEPVLPPAPTPVREMVRGNLYINQTYGFEMYRAPDWQPIVAARAALPNAIAALGTSDQSTLLIIGRERAHDTLEAQSAATEKMVQEIYENYRPMPPTHIMVAGSPAIERHFRGAAEKRDWSVVLVTLERDGDVFTILAMTDANSELDQIQENVISKAVTSLHFTAPAQPPS